jgi:hypothetical protein
MELKVSLPTPCNELWDAMTPKGCNRHCATCDTIIHDLSSMTVEEAEVLLDENEEFCVRAAVRPDGSVQTAGAMSQNSRRMIATIGASLSLMTAACQTDPSTKISPRYEISGQLDSTSWASLARLKSDSGKTYEKRIWGDGKFRFSNLRSGTYTLSFIGNCEEVRKLENLVVNSDVLLNDVKTNMDNDCIIIGKLQRADESKLG